MFSEQEEASFCARFDSYCHTVLRNAIRNYTKHISIQEKYEFLAECPETYVKKSCMRRTFMRVIIYMSFIETDPIN